MRIPGLSGLFFTTTQSKRYIVYLPKANSINHERVLVCFCFAFISQGLKPCSR